MGKGVLVLRAMVMCSLQYILYTCLNDDCLSEWNQNATIEERVSLLEIQVAEIEGDVTLLEGDVNFLFDETVIQDERIYNLEQTAIEIDKEVEGHYPPEIN